MVRKRRKGKKSEKVGNGVGFRQASCGENKEGRASRGKKRENGLSKKIKYSRMTIGCNLTLGLAAEEQASGAVETCPSPPWIGL